MIFVRLASQNLSALKPSKTKKPQLISYGL